MRDAGAGEAGPCGSVRRVGRGAGWPGYGQGWPVAKCGQLSLCRTLPFLVGPCDVRLSTFAERPGSKLQSICWVRPSAGGPVPWGRWCSVVWAWAAGRRILGVVGGSKNRAGVRSRPCDPVSFPKQFLSVQAHRINEYDVVLLILRFCEDYAYASMMLRF